METPRVHQNLLIPSTGFCSNCGFPLGCSRGHFQLSWLLFPSLQGPQGLRGYPGMAGPKGETVSGMWCLAPGSGDQRPW